MPLPRVYRLRPRIADPSRSRLYVRRKKELARMARLARLFLSGTVQPDFTKSLQVVAVFKMGYCSNDFSINGKNNLVIRSEEMTDAAWVKSNVNVTATQYIEQDGTLTPCFNYGPGASPNYIRQEYDKGSAVAALTFWGGFDVRVDKEFDITVSLRDQADTVIRTQTYRVKPSDGWRTLSVGGVMTGATGNKVRLALSMGSGVDTWCWFNKGRLYEHSQLLRYVKTEGVTVEASTCEAIDDGDGFRCYYTYPTCLDRLNFDALNAIPTTRNWAFCLREGFLPKSSQLPATVTVVRPYMEKIAFGGQKIDPSTSVTESNRLVLSMHDDFNPGPFDSGKTLFNTNPKGSFWRLWTERNKNFSHKIVEFWLVPAGWGVLGDLERSYRFYMGIIDDIEFDASGLCKITIKDKAKKTVQKAPAAISQDNTLLTALVSGDAAGTVRTIKVTRSTEFTNPSILTPIPGITLAPVAIRIGTNANEKDEILIVNSLNDSLSELTVVRGCYGTPVRNHALGSQIREIIVLRKTTATFTGLNPMDVQVGLYLRAGLFTEDINVDSFTRDRNAFIPDATMSGILEESKEIESTLKEIRGYTFSNVWTNEEQKVEQSLMIAPRVGTLRELSDQKSIIEGTPKTAVKDKTRIHTVIIYFDPFDFTSGTNDQASYQRIARADDLEALNKYNYGLNTVPPLKMFTRLFTANDQETVKFFASKTLSLNNAGLREISFDCDIKDGDVQVGDFVALNTAEFVDAWNRREGVEALIVEKKFAQKARIQFTVIALRDRHAYFLWAPSDVPAFATATSDQKRKYGWWADVNGRIDGGRRDGKRYW